MTAPISNSSSCSAVYDPGRSVGARVCVGASYFFLIESVICSHAEFLRSYPTDSTLQTTKKSRWEGGTPGNGTLGGRAGWRVGRAAPSPWEPPRRRRARPPRSGPTSPPRSRAARVPLSLISRKRQWSQSSPHGKRPVRSTGPCGRSPSSGRTVGPPPCKGHPGLGNQRQPALLSAVPGTLRGVRGGERW